MSSINENKVHSKSTLDKAINQCALILITIIILTSTSISQERIKFGLKGGIGLWHMSALQISPNVDPPIEYYYPIGFSLGFYMENKLFEHLSIVNELLYQKSTAKILIFRSDEGILNQKVTNEYILIPVLLKYEISGLWDTYFLGGVSLGYLLKANYDYYDQIYPEDRGNLNITEELPAINTAIELGIGKELDLSHLDFNLGFRIQWGLTEYHYDNSYKSFLAHIGNWKYFGLFFFITYEIK